MRGQLLCSDEGEGCNKTKRTSDAGRLSGKESSDATPTGLLKADQQNNQNKEAKRGWLGGD